MDKVLKQRLVGASILIALAVIFLPMLFDNGSDDASGEREMALELPARESGERQVRRLPLDPEQARRPDSDSQAEPPPESRPARDVRQPDPRPVQEAPRSEIAPPEPADATPDDASQAGGDESGQASEQTSEPVPPAATEQDEQAPPEPEPARDTESAAEAVPDAAADGDWMVQVAVFSSRETANSIRQRLDELGHRVSMDVLVRNESELFRLRTGPYADEATAEQARGQIAATVAGVEPVTRELSGTATAEERRGLAVQVGSFASHNNAERLVGQLTEAGFDAFMFGEEAGGRTIWRVRVGAYESREEAERLLQLLRDERGLEGIVVSHP